MLDTMTATKVVGSLCGALLFFMVANWISGGLYSMDTDRVGFFIDTGDEIEVVEDDAEPMSIHELLEVADASRGQRLWAGCRSCHALEDGVSGVGPHLYGIVDRPKGAVDGFRYSSAMAAAEGTWDVESLNAFLLAPASYMPGTSMNYRGMPRDNERADLIRFLQTIGN